MTALADTDNHRSRDSAGSSDRPPKRRGAGSRRVLSRAIGYGLIGSIAIGCILPFYWMIVRATHTDDEMFHWPPPFFPGDGMAENFDYIVSVFPLWRNLFNSLFVAVCFTFLSVLLCSLCAYGFAFYKEAPGRTMLFSTCLATMMIPSTLGILPFFLMMVQLGWLNNYAALIIPGAAPAFGVFWLHQFMRHNIAPQILDAAKMDGCGAIRIYLWIVMPLMRPALAALAILMFMASWNDFFAPLLVLTKGDMYTYTLMLNTLKGDLEPHISATQLGVVIGTGPVLIIFLLASRHFMAGLSIGGVKE